MRISVLDGHDSTKFDITVCVQWHDDAGTESYIEEVYTLSDIIIDGYALDFYFLDDERYVSERTLTNAENKSKRNVGRPPRYNWVGAMVYLIGLAQDIGIFAKLANGGAELAHVENLLKDWLAAHDEHPAESTIREYARLIIREVSDR